MSTSVPFFLILLTLLTLAHLPPVHATSNPLPPPQFAATPSQHARALSAVDAYIRSIASAPDARPAALPLYQFHPPGVKTRGVLVIWHGSLDSPQGVALWGRYAFENGFNVLLPPLAGHAFAAERLPYALLRGQEGSARGAGEVARKVLLEDAGVRQYLQGIGNGSAPVPFSVTESTPALRKLAERVIRLLEEALDAAQYEHVVAGLDWLARDSSYPALNQHAARFFETDYQRYDSLAYHQLSLVAALPGPLHVGGASLGTLAAVYAAARSKRVGRMVLVAPFFRSAPRAVSRVERLFLEAVEALDLYKVPAAGEGLAAGARVLPAMKIASRAVREKGVMGSVRMQTDTFCLFAEDDGAVDVVEGLRVCRGELRRDGSVSYAFPAVDGLGHSVASVAGNTKYTVAVAKETLRFFATGEVHTDKLRSEEGDPDMPPVPAVDAPFIVPAGSGA